MKYYIKLVEMKSGSTQLWGRCGGISTFIKGRFWRFQVWWVDMALRIHSNLLVMISYIAEALKL